MRYKNFPQRTSRATVLSRSSSGPGSYSRTDTGSWGWSHDLPSSQMNDFPSPQFDRRDALRLSLLSLVSALELELISPLTVDDLTWYRGEVERIFADFLPEDQR